MFHSTRSNKLVAPSEAIVNGLASDGGLYVIDELPKGRKPIKTALLPLSQRKQALNLIKEEVAKGHQAYIVFPLIEESESLSAKAATKEAEELQNGYFKE